MDISGLTSVTTPAEMSTWLAENCLTPIQPGMSGTDFGVIMQKMLSLTGATDAQIAAYLQGLPGYLGDGSRLLADDLTWRDSGVPFLTAPVPVLTSASSSATITWGRISGAMTYTIERALDNGFTNTLTTVYNGIARTFTDTGLGINIQYFYRVNANAPGLPDSQWSYTLSTGTPVVGGQVAKINLTREGFDSDDPGWLNFLVEDWANSSNGWVSGSSPVINSDTGAPTGWTINFSPDGDVEAKQVTLYGTSAPDFPDDVTAQQWYNSIGSPGATLTMTLFGLNPANTYTIQSVHYDNTTLIVEAAWGTVTNSGDQGGGNGTTPLELAFNNVVPNSNGTLVGTLYPYSAGQVAISGLIITENEPVPSGKAVNIVVGNSIDVVLSGWMSVTNDMGTNYALIDASGQPLDWNLIISSTADMTFETIQSVNALADFPQAICNQQWYGAGNNTCIFTFLGMDTAKTYRIKTCSGDEGYVGNGTTIISCNGSAEQSGDPDNNTFELAFSGIAPDGSGNIAVTITSTGGNPIINAIILAEQ